jgi:hypothetical protein
MTEVTNESVAQAAGAAAAGAATATAIASAERFARLETKMDQMSDDMKEIKASLNGVVSLTNRWKGAGAILIVLSMLVGYFSNPIHWIMQAMSSKG